MADSSAEPKKRQQYQKCCECGRIGTRGFTPRLMGPNTGQPICMSIVACEERQYQSLWGRGAPGGDA